MKIENKDEYKNISVYTLELLDRTRNALLRGGISNLYQLVEYQDKLTEVKRIGLSGKAEIEAVFIKIFSEEFSFDDDLAIIPESFPGDILQMSVDNLDISRRIKKILTNNGVETIEQVFKLKKRDLSKMDSMGIASVNELQNQISLLLEKREAYFITNTNNETNNRSLDIETFINLRKNYGLKSELVCEWYGFSKQALSQKEKNKHNKGCWCGKKLLPKEVDIISTMISMNKFHINSEGIDCYLLNNKKDDSAILLVSEKDIKCFYLNDLPQVTQKQIFDNDMQRFTEEEKTSLSTMGKQIYILHEPYFQPNDSYLYQKLAHKRGMSLEEYSYFLYGIPYCRRNTEITDEKIISFLKENTVNGITFIPTTPETLWIRNFIISKSFSIDEFIAFYGYKTKKEFGPNTKVDEMEMQVQDTDSNDFIEQIFLKNPLLGNALFSPSEFSYINQVSHNYVNRLLSNSNEKTNLHDDMVLTLAVINYAKEWNSVGESGFWSFITMKFGYRDSQYKLRNILSGCLQNALIKNQRWFFTNDNGNQYKSTILIHAFSTKRSWLYFCDFLFDFYKENLKWTYIENDPMFLRMITSLGNRIQDIDDDSDENIIINSKYYHFREGIVKLIIHKPNFASQVAMRLVKRIDNLIAHSSEPAKSYEEQLCDEWMSEKIQTLSYEKQREAPENRRSVAIDYSRIKPDYRLYNENQIQITFPDVRLEDNDFNKLQLFLFNEGTVVKQKSLEYYGNDLGKTMTEFTINLEEYLRLSGSSTINPQIIIKCDEKEIYNSGKSLYRDVIVFSNKKEVLISACKTDGYSFFHTPQTIIDYANSDILPISSGNFLQGEFVNLEKNFSVTVNDQLRCFDAPDEIGKPVVVVNGEKSALYSENGDGYKIIPEKGKIQIIPPTIGIDNKFSYMINNKPFDISCLSCTEYEGRCIYEITSNTFGNDKFSFKIIDFSKELVIYQESFISIPNFSYQFNRSYYFPGYDFSKAKLNVRIGSNETVFPIMKNDMKIDVPYLDGEIEIPVPIVKFTDNMNIEWNGNNRYWIKEIPQTLFLYANYPEGVNVSVFLNKTNISSDDKEAFALGNSIHGYTPRDMEQWLDVYAELSEGHNVSESILLGKISVTEQFFRPPKLFSKDGKLIWDRGQGFIGDNKVPLQITICEGTAYQKDYSVSLESEVIDSDFSLPIGVYKYKISKRSKNIFSKQMIEIISGDFYIGDENELRFLNKTIQLDFITCEDAEYDIRVLKKSYIDKINFKGIQYIRSENSDCPVYSGIMFYENDTGRRIEYSYIDTKDKNGIWREKVNPVKIIFINDTTLSLVSESDDGFSVYRKTERSMLRNVYQITDRVQTLADEEDYDSADLYIFSIRGEK